MAATLPGAWGQYSVGRYYCGLVLKIKPGALLSLAFDFKVYDSIVHLLLNIVLKVALVTEKAGSRLPRQHISVPRHFP